MFFRTTFLAVSALLFLTKTSYADVTLVGYGNITVTITPDGAYAINTPDLSWVFSGATGVPLSNLTSTTGADALGGYAQAAFDFQAGVPRHASIRAYAERPGILFTLSNPTATAANTFNFPNLSRYPANLNHLTFSGTFAPPSFSDLASDSPWVFFDASGNTFILSPADNFMAAATVKGPNGEISSGISADIATLPAGFQHRTLLIVHKGINHAFDTWGQALTSMSGKIRPANDADASLNKIGYWTDNGAAYYYRMSGAMTYAQTLSAVKADFERAGIPLGYLQLDSWFYPKGGIAVWDNNGAGIYQYVAASSLFVSGLATFQQNLGLPLLTHARWIDPSSPYRTQYRMSGNVVIDPAYWETVADYLSNSGVKTFEQDWLNDNAHTDFNLTDGAAFLDNMAASMSRRNITMQYCMGAARHYLQSSLYSNLTTIRTSADHLQRERWTDFIYASRLAASVGAWPFTDNLNSGQTSQVVLATLSAGPLGIGDAIGALNIPNLQRAIRGDGVIVKPDVPLMPTDASYSNMAQSVDTPQVSHTWSEFGPLRTHYLFAFPQGNSTQANFHPSELGVTGQVYVYDYFAGTGDLANPDDLLQKPITSDSLYLVLAPVGPSGIAILGDTDRYVSMGRKRVTSYTDHGEARVTMTFAPGETSLAITGYAPEMPSVAVLEGAMGAVSYNPVTNLFRVPVTPGNNHIATIRVQVSKRASRKTQPAPPAPVKSAPITAPRA